LTEGGLFKVRVAPTCALFPRGGSAPPGLAERGLVRS